MGNCINKKQTPKNNLSTMIDITKVLQNLGISGQSAAGVSTGLTDWQGGGEQLSVSSPVDGAQLELSIKETNQIMIRLLPKHRKHSQAGAVGQHLSVARSSD